MNSESIRELFVRRFPSSDFSNCDFRPHSDGFGHNAWAAIMPLESVEATRSLAYARMAEIIEFLRPLQPMFGKDDRIQFGVGFPESVKPPTPGIFKGWIPAARLADVEALDFAAVGGAIGENDLWMAGLWGERVRSGE